MCCCVWDIQYNFIYQNGKEKNNSLCLFPGMLLLFLIGNYGRLPAESALRAEAK